MENDNRNQYNIDYINIIIIIGTLAICTIYILDDVELFSKLL